MEIATETYRRHRIALRVVGTEAKLFANAEGVARPTLLVDEEVVAYDQLPDGQYYLLEFAYEWRYDLMSLARAYVDYKEGSPAVTPEKGTRGRRPTEGGPDANS